MGQNRTLLTERGYAVPNHPGVRLRTVEDLFTYAQAEGVQPWLDTTEVQVRQPRAGRGGRRVFVSGKKKQNTMKTTVVAAHQRRTLWTDAMRPRRMHDATASHTEGVDACFRHFPLVEVLLDEGYLGLRRDHPGKALTPPRKPNKSALPEFHERWNSTTTHILQTASRTSDKRGRQDHHVSPAITHQLVRINDPKG